MAVQWRANSQLYRKYIHELVNVYRERSDVRAFTEILLSVLAIFVFGSFAIRPTLVTITGLNVEINSKRDTLATMDAKIDNIIAAQQLYETNRDVINLLSTAVPEKATPLEYASQIETIAAARNVELISFTVDNAAIFGDAPVATEQELAEGEEPIQEKSLPTSISVQGTYADIFGFQTDIERMRRPVKPEAFLLVLSNIEDEESLLLTLSGEIPYLPAKEIAPLTQ